VQRDQKLAVRVLLDWDARCDLVTPGEPVARPLLNVAGDVLHRAKP
jgi:hypothetical protein